MEHEDAWSADQSSFGNVKLTAMSWGHHYLLYLTAEHDIFDNLEGIVN